MRGMTDMATLPGYYTVYEAAQVIGVSHSQVTRYIKSKLLEAVELGHQKLIEQEAVHKFQKPSVGNPNFRKKIDPEKN
jgi:excisionase family DNA binding protein